MLFKIIEGTNSTGSGLFPILNIYQALLEKLGKENENEKFRLFVKKREISPRLFKLKREKKEEKLFIMKQLVIYLNS